MIDIKIKKLPDFYLFQAENINGRVVGSAIVKINQGVLEIQSFQIMKENRGVGYGSDLICAVIDFATENNTTLIDSEFYPEDGCRDLSKRFYERNGFKVEGGRVSKEL
jgi:ribosomal protein S18 acetylase RimI-like enzyme